MPNDWTDVLRKQFSDIIVSFEQVEQKSQRGIELRRATMILVDSSVLRLAEVWRDNFLLEYRYYWLKPDGTLITGWDNCHPVKGIATSPHHKHVGSQANKQESYERDIFQVLKLIRDILTSGTSR